MQITAILFQKWAIGSLLLALATRTGDPEIQGRWTTKPSDKGNVTSVNFKADNHFDGFVNKKPFVTGTYQFHDSELYFIDNGCEGKTGRYKVIFFGQGDSIRFESISDSCNDRAEGMRHLVMGRIKN